MKLKPISEQTIVITGATSGIGLTTARMAVKRGAKVVLVARNEEALKKLNDEIYRTGGQAAYAVADVADPQALQAAADKTVADFGGFDTWVNNAACSVYGRIMEVPVEDLRRLFETNFWGVVNGSKIAVEHLKEKGGALINLGSEASESALPLQGLYSASKHAVKGFTESLRMELESDHLPISVTLIKPTAIHTPFPANAKSYLPYEPQLPPPLYAPELVAEGILYCAEHRKQELYIGGMAKLRSTMAAHASGLYEMMNETLMNSMQNSGKQPNENRHDGLYETNSRLEERGPGDRFVIETSVYQQAKLHPYVTGALLVGGALLLGGLGSKKRNAATLIRPAKALAAILK